MDGWVGEGKGRVYRFFENAALESDIVKEVQSLLAAGFTELPADKLGQLLSHQDRRIRLESQWELAKRGDTQQFLATLKNKQAAELASLHATWGSRSYCTL